MARTKLNATIRQDLKSLAAKLIDPAEERQALTLAYAAAAPLVRATVEAKYRPADMKVLARYELMQTDLCIRLAYRSTVREFEFAKDEGVAVAKHWSCSRRIFAADEPTEIAVEAWVGARDAHKKAVKARYDAYAAMIDSARFLDEVVDLWPEAAQVKVASKPLVVLNDATLVTIRADCAERQAAA